jgi:hypothetical protein
MTTSSLSHDDEKGMILQRILFCPTEERTARELHSMDKDQRQQVWADMTGHAATIDYRMRAESPELIADRLASLEQELAAQQVLLAQQKHKTVPAAASISGSSIDGREAYLRAVQQNAAWVQEQKLKFLRAEDFEPVAAAARMIRHFALKEQLFGPNLLGRDLILQDLSAEDRESLQAGGFQFLSQPDHAGRGIFFSRTKNYKYQVRENQVCSITAVPECGRCRQATVRSVSCMSLLVTILIIRIRFLSIITLYITCICYSFAPCSTWPNTPHAMNGLKRWDT